MTTPLIVIQRITIEWGKDARGGELANRRGQVPKQISLPVLTKLNSSALVHDVKFTDYDAFAKADERVYQYDDPISAQPPELELQLVDDSLLIIPYTSNPLGRGKKAKLIFGQTAKYEWNERLVLDHTWRYKHIIINVGLSDAHSLGGFFNKTPVVHYSHLSQMY